MPFSIANGGQIKVEDNTHLNIEERTQIHLLVEANDMNPNVALRTTYKFNLYVNIINLNKNISLYYKDYFPTDNKYLIN